MSKKVKNIIVKLLCIVVISFTCFCVVSAVEQRTSFADSGHSTSHHSRSSSSKSKSRSSSSSRSKSRSTSSSSRSTSSSSKSNGESANLSTPAAIALVIIFVGGPFVLIIISCILSVAGNKKNKNISVKKDVISQNLKDKIKAVIPDFNEKEFLDNGFKIYKDIQVAWMNFNIENVRNVLTDEMFNMYQSQLNVMEASNEQNIMRDMIMRERYVTNAIIQNGEITIVTQYVIDQYDYVVDRATGKTIRGEDKYKMRVHYEMRFRQHIDSKAITNICPNCGAKIDKINGAGVCEYCGSKIVSNHKNWVLTEKKVINQDYI